MDLFVLISLLFFLSYSIVKFLLDFSNKTKTQIIFNMLSVLFFLALLLSYLIDDKNISVHNKKIFDDFYMENKEKLDEEVFNAKCKNFPQNIKNNFGICDLKKSRLSYSFIESKKVMIYVSDGLLYKDPYLMNKLQILLIREFYREKDMDIKEYLRMNYREGPTYLSILQNSMDLCEHYYSFSNSFNETPNKDCGIIYKVVPASELPKGKVYVVKEYEEGGK